MFSLLPPGKNPIRCEGDLAQLSILVLRLGRLTQIARKYELDLIVVDVGPTYGLLNQVSCRLSHFSMPVPISPSQQVKNGS